MKTHNLILMRHGEAEPTVPAEGDQGRELTERGREDASACANWLDTRFAGFSSPVTIVASPYTRAQATSRIVETVLLKSGLDVNRLANSANFTPEARQASALEELDALCSHYENVLLVTHQPLVSRLIGWLVSGEWSDNLALPSMRPSSLCWLQASVHGRACYDIHAQTHPQAV